MTATDTKPALLAMRGITKEFPGVKALDGVNFSVQPGEVHAICGENGAGKSTLMKILSGLYPYGSYKGDIVMDGQTVAFHNIRESQKAGVAIVFQELSLIKELSVAENIFLGQEQSRAGVIDWHYVVSETQRLLDDLGFRINPRETVKNLGIGQQQLVEIAKAMSHQGKILILDEPTSALAENEVETLLALIRRLRQRGVSSVIISHKLKEVFAIADRISIFRDGKSIITYPAKGVSEERVIADMVGRGLTSLYPSSQRQYGALALEVERLSVPHPERLGHFLLKDISFSVRQGEILGIAGLMGAGRSELLLQLFGAGSHKAAGVVKVAGQQLRFRSPQDAIQAGLALVSEDRKRLGLLLEDSVAHNMSLAALDRLSHWGILDARREMQAAQSFVKDLRVKTPGLLSPVKNLSGGNQQKVVLAKWMLTQPKVLFLDEPTRGIDVGARAEIYKVIHELAGQGLAIIMVSSELPEVIGLSDRILVMNEGRLSGQFMTHEATQEKIMACATHAEGRRAAHAHANANPAG